MPLTIHTKGSPEEGGALLGTTIHTQGGPVIEGDLTNTGVWVSGNLVLDLSTWDDDKLNRLLAYLQPVLSGGQASLRMDMGREQLTVTAPDRRVVLSKGAADELAHVAARQADERAYLSALVVNPYYGRWAAQYVPLAGRMSTLERPLGWTAIKAELLIAEIEGQGPGRLVRWQPLEDITQATAKHEALILLGDPGSGKTTTLYRLALDAAQERLRTGNGRLPLLVPLSAYRGYASPEAFVEARWQQVVGDGRARQLLRDRQLLLLCDALNEMPHESDRDYRQRVAAWGQFVVDWPGNQVVFSSRSLDYTQKLALHQVRIERLDDARVHKFLVTYLDPVKPGMGEETWARLKDDPLLDLVRNPYYLDMLATSTLSRK